MSAIWIKEYPAHVPAEINPDRYQSLLDIYHETLSKYKDHAAFENMGTTHTYQNLDDHSSKLATYLQTSCQIKKDDKVAIMMPNLLQYPISLIATFKVGGIVVNINPLYTPRELHHQLKDSQAKTIIILENFCHVLENALENTHIETIIICKIGDMLGGLKGPLINFVIKNIKKWYLITHSTTPPTGPTSYITIKK